MARHPVQPSTDHRYGDSKCTGVSAYGSFGLVVKVGLMRELSVVLLHGCDAERGWKLFLKSHQELIDDRGIQWLWTLHTIGQALQIQTRPSASGAKTVFATLALAAVLIGRPDSDSKS